MEPYLRGAFGEAAKAFTAALNEVVAEGGARRDRIALLLNRARAHFAMELNRRALKDCDACLALDERSMAAHLLKARVLRALGKEARAVKQAQLALGIAAADPTCDAALCADISALIGKRKSTPRAAALAPAGSAPPIAAAAPPVPSRAATRAAPPVSRTKVAAAAAAAASPGAGQDDVNRGFALVNTAQYAGAIAVFDAVVADARTGASIRAAALLGRGSAYAMSSALVEACADFEHVVALHPNLLDAWKRLGQVRAALSSTLVASAAVAFAVRAGTAAPAAPGCARGAPPPPAAWFQLALDAFDRARAIVAESGEADAELLVARAQVLGKMKDWRRAVATLDEALRAEGAHPRAETLYHAGVATSALGRCAAASALLERAAAALAASGGGGGGGVTEGQVLIKLAQTRRDFGDAAGAMAAFRRAVAASAATRDALAQQRARAPAATHALFDARGAELARGESNMLHMEGLLLHGIGLHVRALASCRRALALNAADENAQFLFAICAQAFGDYDASIEMYVFVSRGCARGRGARAWPTPFPPAPLVSCIACCHACCHACYHACYDASYDASCRCLRHSR